MQKPPFGTLLKRALRLRCVRCGESKMFASLFKMHNSCEHCKLKYERAPGYFLGSLYINYGLTAMILTVSYIILYIGYRIPNEKLTPFLVTFCIAFPLFFWRYARALWLAMDSHFDREEFWNDGE